MSKKPYTWKPDIPDKRDYLFTPQQLSLPDKVDLRDKHSRVYDQGQLGSCTANAIALAYDFERVNQHLPALNPSRLFIYYNERLIENTVRYDAGAMIRDGIKVTHNYGVPTENYWPYIISKFTAKPSVKVYSEAKKHVSKQYLRLNSTSINDLKSCLSSGFGFVFGFAVYESFESHLTATTGVVSMPQQSEKLLGGHAVFCVGYDDSKQSFIVRNSWGLNWGDKGHFYIPYEYLTDLNLADDFLDY